MTKKTENRLKNVGYTIVGGLAVLVIGAVIQYVSKGVIAGNESGEKISIIDKKVDEHINCHKAFEMGIELRLKEKADKEDENRLDDRLNRIESLLLSNSKMLKVTSVNQNSTYRNTGHGGGVGASYDTTR